jgi:hypothetical protein
VLTPKLSSGWVGLVTPVPITLAYQPYAILTGYTCTPTDDNDVIIFEGSATYEQGGPTDAYNTLINFGSNRYEKVCWDALDINDQKVAVRNSAGDRFIDPVVEIEERLVIKISKPYPLGNIDPAAIPSFFNTVNLNPITIANIPIPARSGFMYELIPSIQVISRTEYIWRVDYQIEVRPEGETYDREVLDQGFYELVLTDYDKLYMPGAVLPPGLVKKSVPKVGGGTEDKYYRRVKINTTQNQETGSYDGSEEPSLLNKEGGRLENITPGNEKYLTFQTKPKKDWSGLALPATVWEII